MTKGVVCDGPVDDRDHDDIRDYYFVCDVGLLGREDVDCQVARLDV